MLQQPSPIAGLDWAGAIAMILIFAVPAALIHLRATRPITRDRLQRIAAAWGADTSPGAGELVRRYLERGRRFRAAGFAIGWSIPMWATILRGTAYPGGFVVAGLGPLALVLGVTGGIVAHEATYRLPSTAAVASVSRRTVGRYLNAWQLFGPIVAGTIPIVLVFAAVGAFGISRFTTRAIGTIVSLVAMAGVLAMAGGAIAAIVVRRQNLADPLEFTVDESSRRLGAITVSRAAFAAALTTLGSIGWTVDFIGDPGASTWLPGWAMFLLGAAGLAGLGYTTAAAFINPLDVRARPTSQAGV